MSERVKIRLSNPFEWHGRPVEEIEIREPTGWEAATIGEPRILVHNAAIGGYFVEMPEVISKYLAKIVSHETGADVFKLLGLEDMLKVKAALFDFFAQAEAKIAAAKLASFVSAPNAPPSQKSVN
jgi:hypothetical protein